jgi:hypothetical protein
MIELKTTCSKCGGPLEENRIGKQRYCLSCHAANMRENRVRHSELTDEQRQKANARSYANVYLRRGYITRGSCEVCGDTNAEMHHDDYSKPTEIRWLCRVHHLEHHRELEKAPRGTYEKVDFSI